MLFTSWPPFNKRYTTAQRETFFVFPLMSSICGCAPALLLWTVVFSVGQKRPQRCQKLYTKLIEAYKLHWPSSWWELGGKEEGCVCSWHTVLRCFCPSAEGIELWFNTVHILRNIGISLSVSCLQKPLLPTDTVRASWFWNSKLVGTQQHTNVLLIC